MGFRSSPLDVNQPPRPASEPPPRATSFDTRSLSSSATTSGSRNSTDRKWFRNIFRKRRTHHPKVAAATTWSQNGEHSGPAEDRLAPMPPSPPPTRSSADAISPLVDRKTATSAKDAGVITALGGVGGASAAAGSGGKAKAESVSSSLSASRWEQRSKLAARTGQDFEAALDAGDKVGGAAITASTSTTTLRKDDFPETRKTTEPSDTVPERSTLVVNKDATAPRATPQQQHAFRANDASGGDADVLRCSGEAGKVGRARAAASGRTCEVMSASGESMSAADPTRGQPQATLGTDRGSKRSNAVIGDERQSQNGRGRTSGSAMSSSVSGGMEVFCLDVLWRRKTADGEEEVRRWRPARIVDATVNEAGDAVARVHFTSPDVVHDKSSRDPDAADQGTKGGEAFLRLREDWHRLALPNYLTEQEMSNGVALHGDALSASKRKFRPRSHSSSRRRGRSSSKSHKTPTRTDRESEQRSSDRRRRARSSSHHSTSTSGRSSRTTPGGGAGGGGGGNENERSRSVSDRRNSAYTLTATPSMMATSTSDGVRDESSRGGRFEKGISGGGFERESSGGSGGPRRSGEGSSRSQSQDPQSNRSNVELTRAQRSRGSASVSAKLSRDRSRGGGAESVSADAGCGDSAGGGLKDETPGIGSTTDDNAASSTSASSCGIGNERDRFPVPAAWSREATAAGTTSTSDIAKSNKSPASSAEQLSAESAVSMGASVAVADESDGLGLESYPRGAGNTMSSSPAPGDNLTTRAGSGKVTGTANDERSSRRTSTRSVSGVERHAPPSSLRSQSTASATSVGALKHPGKEDPEGGSGGAVGAVEADGESRSGDDGAGRSGGAHGKWNVGEPGARGPMAGDRFDCLDYFVSNQTGKSIWKWREAEVVDVRHPTRDETEVLVHFVLWATKWNRWISLTNEPQRFACHLSSARPAEERMSGSRASISHHHHRGSNSTLSTATPTPTSSFNNSSTSSSSRGYVSDGFADTAASARRNRGQSDRLVLPKRVAARAGSRRPRSPGGTLIAISSTGSGSPANSDDSVGSLDSAFREAMKRKGLSVIDVEPDGNCLFRSVSHQIYGDVDRHGQVRKACVDHMSKHKLRFGVFVAEDFRDYLYRIRQPGVWGDDLEIRALEEMFDRPIEIYSSEAEDLRPMKIDFDASSLDQEAATIKLSYHGQSHYNSVRDKSLQYPLQPRRSKNILQMRQTQHARTPRSASVSRAGGGRAGCGNTASNSLGRSRGVSRLRSLRASSLSASSRHFGGRSRGRSPHPKGGGGGETGGGGRAKKKAGVALRTLLGGVSSRMSS